MTTDQLYESILKQAEEYALDVIKSHHSDIASTKAKIEFASIVSDVMYGASLVIYEIAKK